MNKRIIANILKIAIGIVLTVCGYTGFIDAYWGGMGTALLFVGILSFIRQFRYSKDIEYKEKVDVESNDERNRYIQMKAWSWSGYFFVIISAFASIILKIAGYDQYSSFAGGCVCLIVLLYWVSFVLLRRKY